MSDKDSKAPPAIVWTASQLSAIRGLLVVLVVVIAGRLICNRTFIDDPQPEIPARANDLADRLDPNTATWEELAAIPGLGEKKAHAIVEFRDKWGKTHPNAPAYSGQQDLRNVKGIGPATASNLMPYLIFPKDKKSGVSH